MGKKRAGGANKSQAIRDYKSANPDAGPKQIAEEVSKAGTAVTPAFVSTVLSNAKRSSGSEPAASGKRGRKPATAAMPNVESLLLAKKLADGMGGIESARQALAVLAKLFS